MAAKKTVKMLEAKFDFHTEDGRIQRGDLVPEDHPMVKAYKEAFAETEYERPVVEQATAAPAKAE